jgi:hypothetical protein
LSWNKLTSKPSTFTAKLFRPSGVLRRAPYIVILFEVQKD